MEPHDSNTASLATLISLYRESPVARAAFDHLASRSTNARVLKAETVITYASSAGYEPRRYEAVNFLKALARAGYGRFVVGRGKQPTRVELSCDIREVARAARDESSRDETGATDLVAPAPSAPQVEFLTHTFRLRRDCVATFELPDNLTKSEAERVAEFIRTLPFDDA